ncbi:zinc-binding dehydrogenase [Taibaiella lutea]|uniref:Zinc-binding dehydrogenase n=1 Tax=Taibaiella lutea TaxID=2608001 RepID=A0A5M6CTA1_9BACT|nr:bi-domain-containing oxidoreductase [Taibaiella lutea]KAA5536245.1 zinc-binding dehydrogenase [Taibaiella lutea]
MEQLVQQLKSGKMEILEVPFPALAPGQILVRNHYSVISAGTEGKTVTDARKGYIAKARSRQKEVKQVIEMVKLNGLISTYKFVMNKLDAPSALGYSTSGEVIAVASDVTEYKVGDYVACGGASASHADVIAVPVNLVARIPENVEVKQAAFSTIAAIAIQGIRQADLRLGENCLIIGMGLIGQLTAKILSASGVRTIGVDVSDIQIKQAIDSGIENVFNRNTPGIEDIIAKFSNGYGVDAIIITAGTSSLDPVELAGKAARKKAKVVIVGAVPTGFDRVNYYKKELDLRMSMSYGPGRGDINYEEKGQDYPIGYVRWTEKRNMLSFLDLLAAGKLDISNFISHSYNLENAPDAYDMILSKNEPFNGIVIEYDKGREIKKRIELRQTVVNPAEPNVGMIGAGNFAQGTLMPQMKGRCNFIGIATARGNMSKYTGTKYDFSYCAESAEELFQDVKINTIFITTRHNSHAEYVIKAIESGKHVFVEKPLAMNEQELEAIKEAHDSATKAGKNIFVMVGFNRRFAPAILSVRKMFVKEQAKSINIRVNSGVMPADHWVNDPEIGGGRIIGEGCHFIDLAMFLAGAEITSVSAVAMIDPNGLNNTVVVNMEFENGSVASVNYFANGSKALSKELIEVFCGGTVVKIDDFKTMTVYNKAEKTTKYKGQDKGHANEVHAFLDAIKNGSPQPIPFEECMLSSLATIKILQSIKENRKIQMK